MTQTTPITIIRGDGIGPEIMEAALRRDADEAVRLLTDHFTQTLEFGRVEIRRLDTLKAARAEQAKKARTQRGRAARQAETASSAR